MKIVCIDAFKPSYLKYAPYLRSLTKKYQWGELETPLGFWGGMETFFKGESDTLAFFYRTDNSSLKWTKKFTWLTRFPLTCLINFIRLVKDQRQFFSLGKIPLKKLNVIKKNGKRDKRYTCKSLGYFNFDNFSPNNYISHFQFN